MLHNLQQKVKHCRRVICRIFTKEELEFITLSSCYTQGVSFAQNVYNIVNGINEQPTCRRCSSILKFRDAKSGYGEFCSRKCSNNFNVEQIKDTNVRKYGATTFLQSKAGKSKTVQTNLQKFGVDVYQRSNEFKEKVKETWNNKTEQELEALALLRQQQCKSKHNVDYYFQSKDFKNKSSKTLQDRYGVTNIARCKNTKRRVADSKLKNFLAKVTEENNVTLYDQYTGVRDYKKYRWCCNSCNTVFYADLSLGNRPLCVKCFPKGGTNIECKFEDFLLSNGIEYMKRTRKSISPYELDFVITDLNLAFELNGLVWHSEFFGSKDKHYHLKKRQLCEEAGIKLITLYEDDIISPSKFDIIKSRVLTLLHKDNVTKINARCCNVKLITGKQARSFLIENHLNGYAPSSINYGLFHKEELIHVCTFIQTKKRKIINSKNDHLELVRSCTKKNNIVRGGLSKIIHRCFNDNKIPIITFSDLDWGTNSSYVKAGFKFLKRTEPGYFFVYKNKRYHRFRFTRSTIKHLELYDYKKTVLQNCRDNGIDRLWNCGNELFIYGY
jgi:hypothetical protein